MYDILKQKEHKCKKIVKKTLTQKKLWTFECPKINLIFKSPYHNHFEWISNFFSLHMYVKK